VLRNTPVNLVQWVVDPQRFLAGSAMPVTGISEPEARDVAAYLYAH
jgi:cytochrome c2